MKINRLKLVNFRQHARSELTFDTGITGIIGPNGSGKTTVLEAVAWALYGNAAVRGTRDSIRYLGAGPRAAVDVELDFDLAGHNYRVTRGLTTASVFLDGADTAIANSITGVNELLQRRLGMSRSEFFNTYFTGQKELSVMASMGPTERAQFLSRVLGYERLRTAQDLLREQRRMIGAEIAGLRSGMPDADTVARTLAEAEAQLASCVIVSNESGTKHAIALAAARAATPVWESMQRQREQWQRLLADVTIAEREIAGLMRERERIDTELTEIGGATEELQTLLLAVAPLRGYIGEMQQLDELFRQQGRRQTLVDGERVLGEELLALRDRYAKLEGAPGAEAEATATLAHARAALDVVQLTVDTARTAWVRDRQEAETKLQDLRRQYTDVKQQRERMIELGADGVCPTCNRTLGETYGTVVEQLGEQLETLRIDGQYYRDREDQLKKMPAEIAAGDEQRRILAADVVQWERRLTEVQLSVKELPRIASEIAIKEERRANMVRQIEAISDQYDAERHRILRIEIERLTPLDNRAARLSASVERIPVLVKERDRIVADAAAATERLEALRLQGATTQFSEHDYNVAREAFAEAAAEVRTTELAVVRAQSEVRGAQQAVDAAMASRREYARIAETLAQLQGGRIMHDELDRAYADLRTDLNFQLRPELSELASNFLSELTDERYAQIELDDQYNLIILEDGVPKPVISGGEEDLANLVLRLAISQMIADRAGQAFSLLILDEVFGSLDATRRGNVVDLLRRLQDRFEQVILITHIESVRDGMDRVVTVRYDQESNASVVESEDGLLLDEEAAAGRGLVGAS